ncbi:hypothetical protein CC2G_014451 [Coprinopsis cinerea AmutBmut pab1-1]|nr:hypothetical protein CC2G_014451 [Coprinopsis cinerea AmutBmut pab1-1]
MGYFLPFSKGITWIHPPCFDNNYDIPCYNTAVSLTPQLIIFRVITGRSWASRPESFVGLKSATVADGSKMEKASAPRQTL